MFPCNIPIGSELVTAHSLTYPRQLTDAWRDRADFVAERGEMMNNGAGFFGKVALIDTSQHAPMYAQLRDSIRNAITNGDLQPRETLPPEREISAVMGVSRITVRKAITELANEGLLIRQQGSGTYVASRVEKQFSRLSSFSEDVAARGLQVRNEWLVRTAGLVTADEALAFAVSPRSKIFRFQRIRYAADLAMAVEHSAIADFALKDESDVKTSLYDALAATGNRPVRALQHMRAVLFEERQAELLGIAEGAPAFFIERRGFNSAGKLVELTKSWYRGDAYDFVAEINVA